MSRIQAILLPILLIAGLAGTAWARPEPVAEAGPAPAEAFDLTEFAGQVVLVDFWASWCGPCRQSLPWLNAMQEKYGPQGLQVVMVNLDRKEAAAARMAARIGPGVRQFRDPTGGLAKRYDLQGMPSSFLYDRSGNLISSHLGFRQTDEPERERSLTEALQRKEP